MTKESDLANKLKNLIKGKNSVLDVGCNYGETLYPFLDLGFKVLHGIDKSSTIEKFMAFYYTKYKFNYAEESITTQQNRKGEYIVRSLIGSKMPNYSIEFFWPEIYKEFKKITFDLGIDNGDLIKFQFNRKYDVIIIRNVLHFFDRDARFEIINKLKSALNDNGLIYIYANSKDRFLKYCPNLENTIKIDIETYQETIKEKRTYHLLNSNDFKAIKLQFDEISDISIINKDERLGEEIIGIMN